MVNMPSLLMNAKSWDSYRSFVDSVDMHVELRNSRLNFAALRGFVDGVPELDLPLSALTATYDGILNDFDLNVASLTVADSSSVSLSGTVADVTDPNRTRFDLPTLNPHQTQRDNSQSTTDCRPVRCPIQLPPYFREWAICGLAAP